jgi:ABC-type transport system involved in multi-copper enzyme maturation permease subunit
VTFILFILLVFASIYVTTNEYNEDISQYSVGVRAAADHLDEIIEKEEDPEDRKDRLMYWGGRMDAVPVPPLSAVVQGLRPFTPIAMHTTRRRFQNVGRGSEINPLAGLLRVPDLVYVVSVVLSLLAILFAFDSICGEKESGTLRLVLSNSVPRDSILLSKWLGGYVVLIVPFLIAAIGGFGYAWWKGVLMLKAENLQRLGMLLLVASLYISVFFTLSLFVSTITHKSATGLFICLLIWVVWILVVPNLAPVIAKIASPAPSVEKINAEKRAVDRETELLVDRIRATGKLRYGREAEQEQERIRQKGEHRKQRWDRFLADAVGRQTNLARTLGRLSPSGCWTHSAVALMNTGPVGYKQFQQAQNKLLKDLRAFDERLRREQRRSGKLRSFTADEVPRLHVIPATFGAALRDAFNDILILVILNVVFFLSAFVLFLRYDVR